MPEEQQWDGGLVKNMIGSPENWRLDSSEEPQLVEPEDKNDPELNPELREKVGHRKGEREGLCTFRGRISKPFGFRMGVPGAET